MSSRVRRRFFALRIPHGVALTAVLCALAGAGTAGGQQAPAAAPEASGPAVLHPTVVLPPVLVAGKPATLAVLDAQGRPAANVAVTLGGEATVTTDATGRAALTAPDAQGVVRASLAGGTGATSATVIAAPAEERSGISIETSPRMPLLRDRFVIRGQGFSGIGDENQVLLGGKPAAVLAASPVALVALPNPDTPLGETQLIVNQGGQSASTGPVSVISIELAADKGRGQPGQEGEIKVGVRGTDRPVSFEVRAEPAGRIELARGNPSRGRTSGGAENSAAIRFTFKQPGEFYLEVRAVPEPLGLPDTEAARNELEEARRLAPHGWDKQIDRVLKLLKQHPQDVTEARDAIEKMLAKKPEGEFGRHLEAAWKILLNRE